MTNTLESILLSGLTVVGGAVVFLYKTNIKAKAEHQETITKMLADAKAERAACQVENQMMREDISKLQEQLIAIHEKYGELRGELAAMQKIAERDAKQEAKQ